MSGNAIRNHPELRSCAVDVLRLLLTERNYPPLQYDYKGTLAHACVDEILRDTHQQYNLLFSPRTL
jgi:hypothetical protein